MEQNKYYTPKIEDLFEGYEFEYQEYDYDKDEYTDQWVKMRFDSRGGLGHDLTHTFNEGRVRVPYLNPNQLIEEGWKESKFVDKSYAWNSMEFLEKECSRNFKPGVGAWCADCEDISYYIGFHKGYGYGGQPIKIIKKITGGFFGGERIETIFHGRCHTMNEFRTLCKQLEMK